MICFVDASYRNNKSYHAFTIKDWNGKTMFERSFQGFESRAVQAELATIIKALQFIRKKNFKNVRIMTDCLNIVESVREGKSHEGLDVEYLNFLLRDTGSKIKWVSRKANRRTDYLCKNVHKPRIKKGLLIS